MINHDLLKQLEYTGVYGCRYTCGMCKSFNSPESIVYCEKQELFISNKNNICCGFSPKIKNPSSPDFQFNDYLEFLGSEYYRPYWYDKNIVVGSARLGEVILDGGNLANTLPNTYSPFYKQYDQPYCSIRFPKCLVKFKNHSFLINYKRYREIKTIEEGVIHFDYHYWKDNPRQRKYQSETMGLFQIGECS